MEAELSGFIAEVPAKPMVPGISGRLPNSYSLPRLSFRAATVSCKKNYHI